MFSGRKGGDKALLRSRALQLYEYFRSTRVPSAGKQKQASIGDNFDKMPQKPFLDGSTALAYTAGVMPSIFASTLAVLGEAAKRFKLLASEGQQVWRPSKIIDWGAGVGSGAW